MMIWKKKEFIQHGSWNVVYTEKIHKHPDFLKINSERCPSIDYYKVINLLIKKKVKSSSFMFFFLLWNDICNAYNLEVGEKASVEISYNARHE